MIQFNFSFCFNRTHTLCVMFSDGDDYKQFFSLKAVFSCSICMKLVPAESADYVQREVNHRLKSLCVGSVYEHATSINIIGNLVDKKCNSIGFLFLIKMKKNQQFQQEIILL